MKASAIIATIVVIVVQILVFVFAWNWLVDAAADAGREQRGGVAFGVTVHFGVFLISFAFVVGSSVSAITSRQLIRWATIGLLVAVWSLYVAPSISSYPIRGSAFYFLGCLILVIGSGIIIPLLDRVVNRGFSPTRPTDSEQAGADQPATALE
jgi:hypothetical protein